jgi:hypothetical protein
MFLSKNRHLFEFDHDLYGFNPTYSHFAPYLRRPKANPIPHIRLALRETLSERERNMKSMGPSQPSVRNGSLSVYHEEKKYK